MDGVLELERVPRKALKKDMDCPICGNPFLEGMRGPRVGYNSLR